MLLILFSVAFAFLVSVVTTPRVREHARRRGILDLPDKERKLHGAETPIGGGFAVFLSVLVTVVCLGLGAYWFTPDFTINISSLAPLLFASMVILLVGLADDMLQLRVRQKVLGQIVAISILVFAGLRFGKLGIFNSEFELGILAIPFTFGWMLFTVNSLNLLDGADGFASTIGIVICLTLAGILGIRGDVTGLVLAAAMAGALAGFLIFNFPPSSIFLGESGSMLIGLTVGTLALQSNTKSAATFALATPVALLAIPLLDSFAAFVRRSMTGRPIVKGDRGHIHHAMMLRGFGPRRLVFGALLLSMIPAIGALLSIRLNNELYAWISVASLTVLLVGFRLFGFNELRLITNGSRQFVESLVYRTTGLRTQESRVGLLDSELCEELWRRLVNFAEDNHLTRVRFDLKGSWMDDGRDVLWEHVSERGTGDNWKVTVPVFAKERLFGKVYLEGNVEGNSGQHLMAPLGDLLDSLGPLIEELVDDAASQGVAMQEGMAKRVLFINRSYWPDVEATGQLLTELCEDLAERGFAISVLAGQPNHVTDEKQTFTRSGVQRRNGVDIYRVRHTKFNKASMIGKALNLVSFTVAATWQSFFIPKHEVVVVESDPFLLAILGGWIKRWRNSKFVMYVQDVYPDVAIEIGKIKADSILAKTVRRYMDGAFDRADEVVVLSNCMRRRLVANGVNESKIRVIPNWADTAKVFPVKAENAFREEHGLDGKFVIMHSGNMGLTQELDQLLDVAGRLCDCEEIVFALVGDGASRSGLVSSAKSRQLTNVRFFPYQARDKLATTLSAADLHVISMHPKIAGCLVPSKFYGIAASGTPMLAIVPDGCDIHELVRDEVLGWTVTPGNTDLLENTIRRISTGELDLTGKGNRCRELAISRFDRCHAADRFSVLLGRTVGNVVTRDCFHGIDSTSTFHLTPAAR